MRKTTIWGLACIGVGVALAILMGVLWALEIWGPSNWEREPVSFNTPNQSPAPDTNDDRSRNYDRELGDNLPGVNIDMDRHFLAQMIPHHQAAVAMAEMALRRAEHRQLRDLAERIIENQTREIEQMENWYRSWYGADAPAGDDRPWDSGSGGMMGGGMMGGGMMGDDMMGDDMMGGWSDLRALAAAVEFDEEFIRQMVLHHQMALMMAEMVLWSPSRPELQELARSIISTQSEEIAQMRRWFRAWYE